MASPSSDRADSVAVITVSYGSESVLAQFLNSVASSGDDPMVIVADNKPAPESSIVEQAAAAGAIYLPMARNAGYGGALNEAAKTLAPSIAWILISNPDVVLHPGAIGALVARGDSNDRIGSVGPAIHTAEGEVYPSARSVPSLRTGVGHALFANIWLTNPWTRAYRNDRNGGVMHRDAGWLSGACVLVRRSAFEELGGFDEDFFMYFEDVDLGYRLGKAGYRNVYEPTATVTHTGAHSTTSDSDTMIRVHHESAKRFLAKKYSAPLLFPVRLALEISLTVRSAVVRRRSHH